MKRPGELLHSVLLAVVQRSRYLLRVQLGLTATATAPRSQSRGSVCDEVFLVLVTSGGAIV
jgi:hypothetical protein